MAIYAYCLLRLPAEESLPSMKGVDSRPVFPFRCDKYTMLLSRLERSYRFSARSIVEHGQVIGRIFENHTVLPMRFGTFFRSEKQITELIRGNRHDLLESFCRLRGKAEMRLKLLLGISECSPVAARKPPASITSDDDTLESGEPMDLQCREIAAQVSPRLRQIFRPLDQQVTCRWLQTGEMVVDCAHLIEMQHVEAYQKVGALAGPKLADGKIRLTGPWPPYHFLPAAVRLPAMRQVSPAVRSAASGQLAAVMR
jgi:hypothetical protein